MHTYIIIILFLRTLISQCFNASIFNAVLIIIQDVCILTTDIYYYTITPHFVSAWDPRVHDTLR